ncbi:MAG: hypothetical protein AAGM67_21645, partial [Bacteroidota bacterium]
GVVVPEEASPFWILVGNDRGAPLNDGTYQLIDASTGGFGVGTSAYYYREPDISYPATVNVATRLRVDAFTLDGIFSGIAF